MKTIDRSMGLTEWVLLLALSVLWGGSFFFVGVAIAELGPLTIVALRVGLAALVLLPLALLVERFWQWPGLDIWAAVFGLVLSSTTLAYLIYFRLLASAGATNLLLVTFLIPASAILLGIFVLGERLEWRHLAGMGLIGLGLTAIDGRPLW
ncbi:DMT family transporter [Halomonas sp. MCCC 1A11036]|uniref:DMT family transporter n=1 Tax=Billgrantia zhangzhouensis TaxID=2733481 RepID=A0ABS9AIL9_9GAMM|nr:DMT family transporter [Halomonas zhangzhouensis]MCE8021612.1 DMT family transporter [Halomonas zhangzhouensis]